MPPLICPQPGPRLPGRDCPLYDYRLSAPGQQLRRAVLADSGKPQRTLADAVRAEAEGVLSAPMPVAATKPTRPVLPRPTEPVVIPIRHVQKGANP